jgi:hypothetical protein
VLVLAVKARCFFVVVLSSGHRDSGTRTLEPAVEVVQVRVCDLGLGVAVVCWMGARRAERVA